ncbi:Non-lysosomal glucosylceramidase [Nymphon striatum]|nr:Non-lysosomal glucosylceramidase [Nymphon striatum]
MSPDNIRFLQFNKIEMTQLKIIETREPTCVPIGGIGSGSIGRGFRGEFCRYHMIPGIYHHEIVHANQFIVSIRKNGRQVYQQVLSTYSPSKKTFSSLSSWNWGYNGEFAKYRALYPQSWTTYELPGQNVTLECQQISPVIPHNYKDSCLPIGIFIWTIHNHDSQPLEVSITFTFKNGIGCNKIDQSGGCWTEPFTENYDGFKVKGVSLHQKFNLTMQATYNIAATATDSVSVSHCKYFDPRGTGEGIWKDLLADGKLTSEEGKTIPSLPGTETGCAVSAMCKIPVNESRKMELCLAWDMPNINFRENKVTYKRRYTRWFGSDCEAGPSLCHYGLSNYHKWEKDINKWQENVLKISKIEHRLPNWYKSALFNELYFVSDGGSLWLEMPNSFTKTDVRKEHGRFAYLESHEYRMYNTYDVHFYASFALAMLWPNLQLSLQYDFCEPWVKVNGYQIHDISNWKDLNVKFVLQVHRDYVITKNLDYLRDMWPLVLIVMEKSMTFDKDNDGLIENDGCADQTFDTWIMSGTSAYCGGLWLAALDATIKMSHILKVKKDAEKYVAILEKGKESFDKKLWTGNLKIFFGFEHQDYLNLSRNIFAGCYYKFDSSKGRHSNSIMSDQLCGHWYHKACLNEDSFLPHENVIQALKTIFKFNVMKNGCGERGAVNGMTPSGKVDLFTLQSEETWIGVTYALSATMIHEGLWEEGMKTAEGMYRIIYEELGLGFQTPEAIYQKDHYRAPGYMRPLAIWGMHWAIENSKPEQMRI